MSSSKTNWVGTEPEILAASIEAGHLTKEEFDEAYGEYAEFIMALSDEWTPEKIRELRLKWLREAFGFFRKKKKEVEEKNYEARKKGLSYQKRAVFATQLAALDALMVETEAKGKKLKASVPEHLTAFVGPSDMAWIQEAGFERVLRMKLI